MKKRAEKKTLKKENLVEPGSPTSSTSDDEPVEALDSQQQDAVIAAFQQQQQQIERTWRIALVVCAALFTVAMALIMACQVVRPQSVYVHRILEVPVGSAILQLLQCGTLFSFFTSGILTWQRTSYAKMVAITTNLVASIMWGVAIVGVHKGKPEIEWSLIWLPIAPLLFLAVILYAQYDARVISEEVRKLESYKYKLTTA